MGEEHLLAFHVGIISAWLNTTTLQIYPRPPSLRCLSTGQAGSLAAHPAVLSQVLAIGYPGVAWEGEVRP